MDLCIITNFPSQHQVEFFNYIAQNSKLLKLKVLYLSSKSPGRMWSMPVMKHGHKIFGGKYLRNILYNPDIGELFKELKYKDSIYIVSGYGNISFQMIMYYLNISKRLWIFQGEKPRLTLNASKKLLMRPLKGAKGILGIGSFATRIYEEILNKPVYNLSYFIDLERFFDIPLKQRNYGKKSLKFLYCGSLIEGKGVDLLVRAFVILRERYQDIELHLIGSGALNQQLISIIPDAFRPDVFFHGFIKWDELHKYYSLGDVFVFPTRYDRWGVAINEALASGLPVITTYNAGAAYDLVLDNYNGFLCPVNSVNSLIEKMEFFIKNKDAICKMGLHARETMKNWTLQKGMERLESIVTDIVP